MGNKDTEKAFTVTVGRPKKSIKPKPARVTSITAIPKPDKSTVTFSAKLKDLRVKHGMSQQEVADKIHTTKHAISQYERGLVMPKQGNRELLCDLFNVSQDYLFGEETYSIRLLNSWEMALIDKYRKSDVSTQRAVRAILEMPDEDSLDK